MEGVIKWYNTEKGFGFIKTEKDDYFVHVSDVVGAKNDKQANSQLLRVGQKVNFSPTKNAKGYVAQDVKINYG
jgi:CspA family cold shock protein